MSTQDWFGIGLEVGNLGRGNNLFKTKDKRHEIKVLYGG
jgi:hypothetical protein